jgi:hypothetical protein
MPDKHGLSQAMLLDELIHVFREMRVVMFRGMGRVAMISEVLESDVSSTILLSNNDVGAFDIPQCKCRDSDRAPGL